MATGKEQYVYRLMEAKCSWGDQKFAQKLNLKTDHGVIFNDIDHPLMNANDHVPDENIFTFGRCFPVHDSRNMVESVDTLERSLEIDINTAMFSPIAGSECHPKTFVSWLLADEDYMIDGAPALTLKSKLPCYCGGVISITLVKESADTDQNADSQTEEVKEEEEKSKIELLPSEVQEKIDAFCDDNALNSKAKGTEVLEAQEKGLQDLGIPEVNSILPDAQLPFQPDRNFEINLNAPRVIPQFINNGDK